MDRREIRVGDCRLEALTEGERFCGLGGVWIGEVKVRSGRLPLSPAIQTFTGLELAALELVGVEECDECVRIRTKALFSPLLTKPMTILFWIAWGIFGRLLLVGTLALLAWDFVRTTRLLDQQLGVKFDARVLPRFLGGTGNMTGLGCFYYLEIVAVYCLSAFVYMVFFA